MFDDRLHCDRCGRFVTTEAPGVSGCQTWGHDMDGTPDLHDPTYRCSPCTDKYGMKQTNCAHPERYMWRNPTAA